MYLRPHVGLKVKSLEKSIDFYRYIFQAEVDLFNESMRFATMVIKTFEFNLFEKKGTASLLAPKAFHLGIRVDSKNEVDAVYERGETMGAKILAEPYERFDGDYTFFLKDPDGLPLEVFYGDHEQMRQESQSLQ